MSAERIHAELKFTHDSRFLPGVRAAVEFIAARDGLSDAERENLGAASELLARECMAGLGEKDPPCKVQIEDFDDRIEVRLEHAARPAEASGAGASKAGTPAARGAEVMRRVDRVLYDARNGISSVTLVKFFSKNPAAR
ncbi:MAG TPA: hypothetical protein VGT03_14030 [Candidatus Acidoferrales bacterium]|nr:hypothetical protein [Candidatus Acidoferrales bacterium]